MVITLCGSARFESHFKKWNELLTLAGHEVFSLAVYPSDKGERLWYTEAEKEALDSAHKRKILVSDAVLLLNVFGYVGKSTMDELEFARRSRTGLYALESWGAGLGVGSMHRQDLQDICLRLVPEYKGSPIDTTSQPGYGYGFGYAFNLLHNGKRPPGVDSYNLVQAAQLFRESFISGLVK